MSPRAPRVCSEPGCPNLVEDGSRCLVHAIKRACDGCGRIIARDRTHCPTCAPNAARARQRWEPWNGAAWRKKSASYRRAHPICEAFGCTQPSAHVDHTDGKGPKGPNGLADWNLQALCRPHHSAKTAAQDGGFGNPRHRKAA